MKRSRTGNTLASELLLTGTAVPTVVGLRLARMAEPPNMTNWIEFNRMVMEKWVAGLEAAQAMGGELVQRQLQSAWQFWPAMGRLWFDMTNAVGSGLMAGAHHGKGRRASKTLDQALSRLGGEMMGNLQRTGEAMLHAGLQPVKKRVVSNQRRLVSQANPVTRNRKPRRATSC